MGGPEGGPKNWYEGTVRGQSPAVDLLYQYIKNSIIIFK
jgi:hypothetical protein